MGRKHTLVTGGAGFIGSHLTDLLLEKGFQVTVIDNFSTGRPQNLEHQRGNPNLTIVEENICNFERIRPLFSDVTYVFHLAALADIVPSIERPFEYHQSNVEGTLRVLQASQHSSCLKKLVYSASSSCYGIAKEYPTPETTSIQPQYPYALTKWLGEQYVMHWGSLYDLPVASLRLFNVFGPRSRTSGTYGAAFGVFLKQKLAGAPFTVVGDGKQTRDFTYVTDIAQAFCIMAESNLKNQIFNVGSGGAYSVNYLLELMQGERVFIPKRPGEPDCTFADISKITSSCDWRPKVPFEQGVKKVLEHIDYWKEAPLWDPESIAKATEKWFHYLGQSR